MTDAHCHPFDLLEFLPNAEEERINRGISCAAESWNRQQFEYIEKLNIHEEESPPPVPDPRSLVPTFGIHPQLPADKELYEKLKPELLDMLHKLPEEGRVGAIGECGFDLFRGFRETEHIQDELFILHLECAVKHNLPLVIHARRAMHKIFVHTKQLKKLPSVIFHSWPGTLNEGRSLIQKGINVYFSFGAAVANNHKEAMRCCALFPPERLLLETDAPYQPLKGKKFSSWEDLEIIAETIARLRKEAGSPVNTCEDIELQTDKNFSAAYLISAG